MTDSHLNILVKMRYNHADMPVEFEVQTDSLETMQKAVEAIRSAVEAKATRTQSINQSQSL